MGTAAKPTRENRTITVNFQNETTYFQLLGDGKAFLELVMAFLLSLGFQLKHTATCSGGGCLTRHSHYARVRLGGVTIWRIQCTTCQAVFTVLPHFVLRYRHMHPDVARDALLATHGGLSLELCAVIGHISPMALYRLVCALGQQSLVALLTRCGLPLPVYFLADEKHSHCLTDKVYLPTVVHGRVLWHLGYTDDASAAAFTQSYGAFQRAASQQEPSYRVKGVLIDGFDNTSKSMRTLFPGARLGNCLRHALNRSCPRTVERFLLLVYLGHRGQAVAELCGARGGKTVDDLARFCCHNHDCRDHGQRGAGNLTVCMRYGKHQHLRLLYCRSCKARFSERQGTPFFGAKLETATMVSVLDHVSEGCGVRKTSRLTGVHRDTVLRDSRLAGAHAHDLHDALVAFSPSDARDAVRREMGLREEKAEAL